MGSATHFAKLMGSQELMEPMLTEPLAEVNLSGLGASHDTEGGLKTCFLFNFAPKMGYLLCVIDHYHSDVTVQDYLI